MICLRRYNYKSWDVAVAQAAPIVKLQRGSLLPADKISEGQQRGPDRSAQQQEIAGEGEGLRQAHEHGDGERPGGLDRDAAQGEERRARQQE